MKFTKIRLGVALFACFVMVAGLIGCQTNLSDEDIDRMVNRMTETPLNEEDANRIVDALMAHPKYQEYLVLQSQNKSG